MTAHGHAASPPASAAFIPRSKASGLGDDEARRTSMTVTMSLRLHVDTVISSRTAISIAAVVPVTFAIGGVAPGAAAALPDAE